MRHSWSSVAWWWAIGLPIGMVLGAACGGRVSAPECPDAGHLCAEAVVCCPADYECGNGENGCPLRSCCLEHDGDAPDVESLPSPSWGDPGSMLGGVGGGGPGSVGAQ